jgi:hypothetical protein
VAGIILGEELRPRDLSREDLRDRSIRRDVTRTVDRLAPMIIEAGLPLSEVFQQDNAFLLLAGTHIGALLNKPGTRIHGQPGCFVQRLWAFAAPATTTVHVSGIHFMAVTGADNLNPLVTINATAKVVFHNCTFERLAASSAGNYVTIAAGGKGIFQGCTFLGVQTGGSVVNNAGAAAAAAIIGCYNLTTRVHVNCTTIFETV